jgi:membrane-associated phospholipid phosphatase
VRFYPALAAAGMVLLALAAAFAAVTSAHPGPFAVTGDRAWLSAVVRSRDGFLTGTAKAISVVASPAGWYVVAGGVAVFLFFVRKRRAGAVFIGAAVALTSGASQLIKHLVLRPRPPHALVPADLGSFPSGHVITTLAASLALALVLARPGHRRVPFALVAVATLVMIWTRTYLGEHWLSDTVESVLVSAGVVVTGWAFAAPFAGPFAGREAERAAGAGGGDGPPPPGSAAQPGQHLGQRHVRGTAQHQVGGAETGGIGVGMRDGHTAQPRRLGGGHSVG